LIGSSSLLAVWDAGMDFGVWLRGAAGLAIADNAANHALLIQPNSVLALRAKAFALRAQGKWQEAEAVLHRMIDLQPTEANSHWELGQVLMAEGRHQEALESFEAAKRFAGGSDSVFIYDAYLAMAELALGQLAEATAMARLSLSEFPPDSRQPKVARRPAPGRDARQLTLAHGAA
jgi:tetratricopeptide (TPR) repeat protein